MSRMLAPVLLLFLSTVIAGSDAKYIHYYDMTCDDGPSNYSRYSPCDGTADCADASDERLCLGKTSGTTNDTSSPEFQVQLEVGKKFKLTCIELNWYGLEWTKNFIRIGSFSGAHVSITTFNRLIGGHLTTVSVLTKKEVTLEDAGLYECKSAGSNSSGKINVAVFETMRHATRQRSTTPTSIPRSTTSSSDESDDLSWILGFTTQSFIDSWLEKNQVPFDFPTVQPFYKDSYNHETYNNDQTYSSGYTSSGSSIIYVVIIVPLVFLKLCCWGAYFYFRTRNRRTILVRRTTVLRVNSGNMRQSANPQPGPTVPVQPPSYDEVSSIPPPPDYASATSEDESKRDPQVPGGAYPGDSSPYALHMTPTMVDSDRNGRETGTLGDTRINVPDNEPLI